MIGPGCITISRPDLARHERTREREAARRHHDVDRLAADLLEYGEFPDDSRESTREITAWSSKSRSNFVHVMCELDYAPMFSSAYRLAAMVTLTYPADWLTVAPQGKAAKAHLRAFQVRYKRAWGEALIAVWKLEFQRRGAPHFHLLVVPPHGKAGERRTGRQRTAVGDGLSFKQWLSIVWADIVAHPDPVERMKHEAAGTGLDFAEGLKATDPKRVAVYFLKHGGASAKEYQHIVPEAWQAPGKGPGRFWGYWGLERVTAGREVDPATAIKAVRLLRR
ncbi:rolling circle replication-associated protein, partial [Streptomyces griseus]|uniref:rolling circle replication-associated protein n=2 Tax=Actinomycetes TaxID=1760 RepID=UPI003456D393